MKETFSHIPCLGKCGSTVCNHECFCCIGKTPPCYCKHEYISIIGAVTNTHLCVECGQNLLVNEVEILGMYYEIGAFCGNDNCKRYMILVA